MSNKRAIKVEESSRKKPNVTHGYRSLEPETRALLYDAQHIISALADDKTSNLIDHLLPQENPYITFEQWKTGSKWPLMLLDQPKAVDKYISQNLVEEEDDLDCVSSSVQILQDSRPLKRYSSDPFYAGSIKHTIHGDEDLSSELNILVDTIWRHQTKELNVGEMSGAHKHWIKLGMSEAIDKMMEKLYIMQYDIKPHVRRPLGWKTIMNLAGMCDLPQEVTDKAIQRLQSIYPNDDLDV
ncbi:hypothetical protein K493DRAFT_310145 [Basidiobolus meristosporus CBS 931.73]|uniref:Uncharacterized protein n=1 Tax=Basidiobolus meristosporus CBS 931.73 TaxID=1314790 RepID=A0A1Y1ZBE3_9FUNG|nr:hypothetical protein K493DRAFT_310145 [Basidiobolus meristosporus CBS 931.73]|eukprot:ORY07601.1 hypothetical protein K493DRAFT_310145 [Basidiobolus meristosporus CBS 931.73]